MLKKAPIPTEFMASFPCTAIHCASKFCCDTYPVNAVPIDTRKVTTPATQVRPRPSRQAPWKKVAHRCNTIKKKNDCTDQKCRLLKKCPTAEKCHHCGPKAARMIPVAISSTKLAMVAAPKRYT